MEKQRPAWFMGVMQLIFVVVVIGLALGFTRVLKTKNAGNGGGSYGPPAAGSADPVLNVSVTNPAGQRFTPAIKLNGIVTARTQTSIVPQVGGQVVRVNSDFKQGSRVKKGTVLFEIDPSDYRLAVEQAQANIAAAQSDLQQQQAEAKLAVLEWDELFPGQPISELAARKPQIAAAEARLAGAIAARKTAELSLRRTKIRTLDEVIVLSTGLNAGQIVGPNQSVGTVFAVNNIEISTPLSVADLQAISPAAGREAVLLQDGDDTKRSTGTVARVNAVLDERTRLASVFIKPADPASLTVGGFVDVLITGNGARGALAVPPSAMAGRDKVWVVDNGALASRRVTRLGTQDGMVIVSRFDVADGVLTLPPVEAYEGQKAIVRKAAPENGAP